MVDVSAVSRKHEIDLRAFRRALFSEAGDSTPRLRDDAFIEKLQSGVDPGLARIGGMKSVVDRHAELSIVGDIAERSELLLDPADTGLVLTLSIAAHHRQLRSRLRVDPSEASAWAREIVGDRWAAHTFTAGALSGVGAHLTTVFFYVFLSATGKPLPAPNNFSIPLTPLE